MPFDMEALKRVPKPVWIVGGGIVVGYVILTRGRGGSGATVLPSTVGGGSGGGEGDQPVISSTDLDAFLADQLQAQTDFYQSITDAINGTGSGNGTGTDGTPGGGGGGTPVPVVRNTVIPGTTAFYAAVRAAGYTLSATRPGAGFPTGGAGVVPGSTAWFAAIRDAGYTLKKPGAALPTAPPPTAPAPITRTITAAPTPKVPAIARTATRPPVTVLPRK